MLERALIVIDMRRNTLSNMFPDMKPETGPSYRVTIAYRVIIGTQERGKGEEMVCMA